jgi:hypothetical protein
MLSSNSAFASAVAPCWRPGGRAREAPTRSSSGRSPRARTRGPPAATDRPALGRRTPAPIARRPRERPLGRAARPPPKGPGERAASVGPRVGASPGSTAARARRPGQGRGRHRRPRGRDPGPHVGCRARRSSDRSTPARAGRVRASALRARAPGSARRAGDAGRPAPRPRPAAPQRTPAPSRVARSDPPRRTPSQRPTPSGSPATARISTRRTKAPRRRRWARSPSSTQRRVQSSGRSRSGSGRARCWSTTRRHT